MVSPRPAPTDLRTLSVAGIAGWRHMVSNDFEAPVFAQHPALAAIKEQLYTGGAVYASLTGSGAALYGIFEKGSRAQIVTPVPCSSFYLL